METHLRQLRLSKQAAAFQHFPEKIERKVNIPGTQSRQELGLHILFLKCDGTKFPRNAYANSLEVYCSTYFYGPLVIVFGDTNPPYRLHDFPPEYLLDKIDPLNELEQKYYPLPFSKSTHSVFSFTYPFLSFRCQEMCNNKSFDE